MKISKKFRHIFSPRHSGGIAADAMMPICMAEACHIFSALAVRD
jgi:hypothetical protein